MVPAVPLVPAILYDLYRAPAILAQPSEEGRIIRVAQPDHPNAAFVLEARKDAPRIQCLCIGFQGRM